MSNEIRDFNDFFKSASEEESEDIEKAKTSVKMVGSNRNSKAGKGGFNAPAKHPGTGLGGKKGNVQSHSNPGDPHKNPTTKAGSGSGGDGVDTETETRPVNAKAKGISKSEDTLGGDRPLFPWRKSGTFQAVRYGVADEEEMADEFGKIPVPSMRNIPIENAAAEEQSREE